MKSFSVIRVNHLALNLEIFELCSDERDRLAQSALARAAGRIAEIGTRHAMILDTHRNVLEDGGHSILIDQKLAENLKFIKEGEFDEKLGAPTLKLVGEVTPVTVKGPTTTIVAHAAIFQENILDKFLKQEKASNPIEYIYAGLASIKNVVADLLLCANVPEVEQRNCNAG